MSIDLLKKNLCLDPFIPLGHFGAFRDFCCRKFQMTGMLASNFCSLKWPLGISDGWGLFDDLKGAT